MTPNQIINSSPMTGRQTVAIALCILLFALDGFDVLAISFASPGIAEEWGINRAALGVVLSMELIGMALGSILMGRVADSYGRRFSILVCLVVMTVGMYWTQTVMSVVQLSTSRFFTGIGIGGMLAAANTMAAEYANDKYRNLIVSFVAAGYPVGAIVGGAIVSLLLVDNDWRVIFTFGALVSLIFIPLVWFFLPESIGYLEQKSAPNMLDKINRTLRKLGHAAATECAEKDTRVRKVGIARLLSAELRVVTLLLLTAYFFQIITFYFLLKWIPKIVVDMGYSASSAGSVLVWANIGGFIGSVILGTLTRKFEVAYLLIGACVVGGVMVAVFGIGYTSMDALIFVSAATGFFTNAAVVGLYPVIARSFPTEVRAGGIGFIIGIGRAGAALSPIFAGVLFELGLRLQSVAVIMGLGSLVAAFAVYKLHHLTRGGQG